ncbi:MAG: LPS export ABC transporter permease LptG [Gammaproteobacteria bacterium]|nr:LPS export ABC transporter permease LptG [Gammaproteobacteria bacterium]
MMFGVLDRYLARQVIAGSLLVALLLAALSSFLVLVGQMDDFQGTYGISEAIQFTLLSMPQQVYELMPMSVLLGSLLGLGNLAAGNELMVMRAAGISTVRLGRSSLLGGLVLALLTAGLGEFVAPNAEQSASALRTSARMNRISYLARGGVWARDGQFVFNVQQMLDADRLKGVSLYELGEGARIKRMLVAEEAVADPDGGWQLLDVAETVIDEERIESRRHDRLAWRSLLDTQLLRLFVVDPDKLSLRGLSEYTDFLSRNQLDVRSYKHAWWQRAIMPLSIIVMVVLALPFVFGPLRTVGTGQRVMFGVLIGVVFYIVNLTAGQVGIVFSMPAFLSAGLPTALTALLALHFLRRVP